MTASRSTLNSCSPTTWHAVAVRCDACGWERDEVSLTRADAELLDPHPRPGVPGEVGRFSDIRDGLRRRLRGRVGEAEGPTQRSGSQPRLAVYPAALQGGERSPAPVSAAFS